MILWDVARASAFVAFACYTLVVAWGIALSARSWRPPAPQLAYHRFLASLGLVAVAIHIGALMLDRYARVTVASLVGLDPRPGVVVGAAALWLVIALPLSFRLKQARWMTQRAWRSLHYFGYAVWGLSLVHGVIAGTDSRSADGARRLRRRPPRSSAAPPGTAGWSGRCPPFGPRPSRERLPARRGARDRGERAMSAARTVTVVGNGVAGYACARRLADGGVPGDADRPGAALRSPAALEAGARPRRGPVSGDAPTAWPRPASATSTAGRSTWTSTAAGSESRSARAASATSTRSRSSCGRPACARPGRPSPGSGSPTRTPTRQGSRSCCPASRGRVGGWWSSAPA